LPLPASGKVVSVRIGELAERIGVNTKTIRYYESIGLVPPPPRTSSGYRIYNREDEVRVAFIKAAQHLGLSLEEIREVLALREAGRAPCEHVRNMLRDHVRVITRRIAELRQLRQELRALDAVIDEIRGDHAVVCRIIEHTVVRDELLPHGDGSIGPACRSRELMDATGSPAPVRGSHPTPRP
jgi:DNA-binding transcriptional MerR regulator